MNPNRTRPDLPAADPHRPNGVAPMIRTPRAADAIRTVRIARELHTLAPEAATVRLTPVWTDTAGPMRVATMILLLDDHGRPCGSLAASRAARDLLRRDFSRADWTRSHRYDVSTGRLYPLAGPVAPAELEGPR